ncbi:6-bladed beta-propeller [Roseivirga echinicomitans]|uniref:6-bladed beta-propeller n=1 Tax=Roseivirga echinicomitans TaxID=296218 RepID=A0A150XYE7_9BACT|nr:6-bladed beta-propeller [Roseivirga echinicomitans]KYG83800.1 hypothetical protein AWN68_03055 [Roseivirga echinicomitans]
MIYNFKFLYFVLIVLLITACNGHKEASSIKEALSISESTNEAYASYNIEAHSEAVPIYGIIDTAELLLLEQTKDTELPLIRFFNIWDKSIVVSTFGYGDIHLFDSHGNLIRNFKRMGDSAQDYHALWYSWLDGQQLAVYDAQNRRVNYYNPDADFVKTVPINYPTTGLYSFNNHFFFDTSDRLYEEKEAINIVVLNNELEYESGLLPYETPEPFRTNWGPNNFEPYSETILYQDPMNNTMFQWNRVTQSFDSLFTIDLGEDWVWDNEDYYGDKALAKQVKDSGEKVIRMKNTVGENYIFLRFEQFGSFHSILIDRKNGKYQKLTSNQGILEDRTFVPLKWLGDKLVFTIEADKIDGFIQDLPEGVLSYKSASTDISANKSAALLWLSFKNSDEWK